MAAQVAPGDQVLEVGGGLGMLTQELARRGAQVRVIELEPAFVWELKALKLPGVKVEEGDALQVSLGEPEKIVANIPYAASSELIERLTLTGASLIVLMLQFEVAERLAARPGGKEWSALGAIVGLRYEAEIVEKVPPQAFWPQPKVASAVVRLRRRPVPPLVEESDYRALVRALFSARRRMIRNSVVRAAPHFHVGFDAAVRAADALGLADRRPEELTTAEFEALTAGLLTGND
jgi:16S rRNA (adenine1518-N6/adenine1519-N6)-dimethyltransferase